MQTGNGATLSENETPSQDNKRICKFCDATRGGRKLVLAFDGTSKQFGKSNSNVVEIYARVEKNKKQLTYYNSGVGTYANPSRKWSWKNARRAWDSTIDRFVAWNFEKIILAGYRWLSDNYQPGDQIFLFGFSRGAYQARVLAGMIHKIGLIYSGNEEQIPFAYELYAGSGSGVGDLVTDFKNTFSHKDASVHFVGAWDTVSSVGIFRSKNLPAADNWTHICFFRHALALDERRVKFLPECTTNAPEFTDGYSPDAKPHELDVSMHLKDSTDTKVVHQEPGACKQPVASPSNFPDEERVKEVWFAGYHSDVGGRNKPNDKLLMEEIPALWMANEARTAGLAFKSTSVEWNWEKLRHQQRTDSLWRHWGVWWILEAIPFLNWPQDYPRRRGRLVPHFGSPRYILPQQKIHVSVSFMQGYKPRAKLIPSSPGVTWDKIIGNGDVGSVRWTKDVEEMLELDLYDTSAATSLINHLEDKTDVKSALDRLSILALIAPGVQSIIEADKDFKTLAMTLSDSQGETRKLVAVVLGRVAGYGRGMLWKSKIPGQLHALLGGETEMEKSERQALSRALLQLYQPGFTTRRPDTLPFIIGALSTEDADLAVSALGAVVKDGAFPLSAAADPYAVVEIQYPLSNLCSALGNMFRNKNIPSCIRASAARKLTEVVGQVENSTLVKTVILSENVIGSLAEMLDFKHRDVLTSLQRDPSKFVDQSNLGWFSGLKKILSSIFFPARGDPISKCSTLCSMLDVSEGEDVAQVFPPEILDKLVDVHGMKPIGSIGSLQPAFIDWLEQALREQLMLTQAATILSLSRLLESRFVRQIILEKSVFNLLKDLFGSKDGDVRENATSGLAGLATNGKLQEKILEVGIVESLGQRLGSLDNGTQRSAAKALSKLANYEKLRSEILRVSIIGLLAKLLGNKDSGVCRSATEALSAMARYSELRTEILNLRFVESLQKQLESQDEKLHRSAIMALSGLIKCRPVRTKIYKIGIFAVLGNVLISTDYFVQSVANRTLLRLVDYAPIKSDILQLDKLVELLKKLLSSGDSDVQCSAAEALGNLADLATYDEIRLKILKFQIIESLMKLLGSRDNDVCHSAIKALSALSVYSDLRKTISKAGFVKSLQKHLGSEDHKVQQYAIDALSDLTKYGELRKEILQVGLVESLQRLLESEEYMVQVSAMRALSDVTKYDSVRTQILEFGIIESLGKLLGSGDGPVQSQARSTLLQLAEYGNIRVEILNVVISGSLKKRCGSEDGDVCSSAIKSLSALTKNNDLREEIIEAGFIKSLQRHLGSEDHDVQQSAIEALSGLSEYDSVRTQILEFGIIELLGELLGSGERFVRYYTRKALSRLVKYENIREEILNVGILSPICKMVTDTDHFERQYAIEVLLKLAEYESARPDILKLKLLESLKELLGSEDSDVQSSAAKALLGIAKLAKYDEIRSEILRLQIIKSLGELLGSEDSDVCSSAIDVLTALMEYGELRDNIFKAGFVSSLKNHLGSEDYNVQQSAIDALSGLTKYDVLHEEILQVGFVESLQKLLGSEEHTVQGSAMRALSDLAKYDPVRTQILKFGFVGLLEKHLGSAEVYVRSCANRALVRLAEYENIRVAFINVGILSSLGELLRSDDTRVRHDTSDTLCALRGYDDLRQRVLELGVID